MIFEEQKEIQASKELSIIQSLLNKDINGNDHIIQMVEFIDIQK